MFILLVFSLVQFSPAKVSYPDKTELNTIEGLHVFPNPVENGKIYITTKFNLLKTIEIYDVLGNRIISTSSESQVLDISKLSSGIYILKIKEKELFATRKLVVR